jgi:hypothetical protein
VIVMGTVTPNPDVGVKETEAVYEPGAAGGPMKITGKLVVVSVPRFAAETVPELGCWLDIFQGIAVPLLLLRTRPVWDPCAPCSPSTIFKLIAVGLTTRADPVGGITAKVTFIVCAGPSDCPPMVAAMEMEPE